MLQTIAALNFAQGATIVTTDFALSAEYQHQLASLPTAIGSSILHSYRIVQLVQQQKAATLICSAHLAVMIT